MQEQALVEKVSHLGDIIDEYEYRIQYLERRIEEIYKRYEELLNGYREEIDDCNGRIEWLNKKVEELEGKNRRDIRNNLTLEQELWLRKM